MKKRLLSILLTVALLTGLLALDAGAAEIVDSGDCGVTGGNVTWQLDSDGTLTISGSGDMTFWVTYSYVAWKDYYDEILTVVVEEGVTDLAPYAFYNCANLTSVTLPSTLDTINAGALQNCRSLTELTIPDTVTSIGTAVFNGCTSLTTVTIPDGITEVPSSAFGSCTSLTAVNLPDSITKIGNLAFSGCTSLTELVMTDSITVIGSSAFSGCTGLTVISIPDNVTSIGNNAFRGCTGLTAVTIGSGVTSIGSNAFYGCTSLSSITFTGSTPSIDEDAFSGVTAAVSYPADDSSWTADVRQSYGGTLTWSNDLGFQFTDDTGTGSWSWAGASIYECYEEGIITGYETSDGYEFRPDDSLTREAAAAIIARAFGLTSDAAESSFSDVDSSRWSLQYIEACAEAGIINGYTDGTFRPTENVTRAQMAKMIAAAAGLSSDASVSSFSDVGTHWALQYIEACADAGIVTGYTDGTFLPESSVTRAAAAAMISRALALTD